MKLKSLWAKATLAVVAILLVAAPGSASAVTHGTAIPYTWITATDTFYLSPEMDTILDGYDTQIAAASSGISGKEPAVTAGTTGQYYRGDKSWQTLNKAAVGLSNVDNTSDTNKPVSTATQTALDGKAAASHTHTASQISDSTAVGRSVLTANDAAAARTAIGAAATPAARSFNNAASRSLTTSTGAAGFQVSSSRDATVNYNVTMSTTSTIGGASTITVALEIAPTNSATPGDWVEISRCSNGQTLTLAVALQSVQTTACNESGMVPSGYYAKLRYVISGTASANYNTGQEVLL